MSNLYFGVKITDICKQPISWILNHVMADTQWGADGQQLCYSCNLKTDSLFAGLCHTCFRHPKADIPKSALPHIWDRTAKFSPGEDISCSTCTFCTNVISIITGQCKLCFCRGRIVTEPSVLKEPIKVEQPVTDGLTTGVVVSNAVEHPPHYNKHPSGVECIDIVKHMSFCLGNAMKYLWRAGLKAKDPIEDLKKARYYIDQQIKLLGGQP